ncbi:MAG: penicillin-binding protein 2 [Clostridia bacterium]|nr:penicillin-binding protein 2 [Clostridia bacterium]
MKKNHKKTFFLGDIKDNKDKFQDLFSVQEGSFRFGQLKDSSYLRGWTEDSFLSGNQDKEAVGRTFNNKKLVFFKIIIFIFMLLLISRIAWLQVVKGEHYSLLSERNRIRTENLESKRGIIYDRSGEALVRNYVNFVLLFRPIDLPKDEMDRDVMLRRLSSIIDGLATEQIATGSDSIKLVADGPSYNIMKAALAKVKPYTLEAYQSIFVLDNLDYKAALQIILEQDSFPGILLEDKILREYPFSLLEQEGVNLSSLSHILGYTGKISEADLKNFSGKYSLSDYVGKTGIEYTWEKELKGVNGYFKYEVDALGRKKKVISETPAQAGYNLSLSLDLKLQAEAERITKEWLAKTKTKRASVIIMDPNNGQILALVSLPAYDNNLFARGIKQIEYDAFINDENRPLFNRAISGELPSGSVIKPIIAAAALEENIITENTSFLSNGGLRIGQWFFPDWRVGGHGSTNVRKAIADSVNTFFYYIGGGYQDFQGLGVDLLTEYMRLFGMGEKAGIDLNGESKGLVPTREWKKNTKNEAWYIGDTYHISIGQGDVLVSPLQVANFTSTIVNGGRLYKPTLVRALLDENNNVVKEIEPVIIRQDFISPNNLRIVREGMRQAVLSGSARSLSTLPVTSGGKTGTAQWSSTKANHAWFIAFAPYEDPLISITVVVEEGKEGSEVAAPIAKEIMQWYFSSEKID